MRKLCTKGLANTLNIVAKGISAILLATLLNNASALIFNMPKEHTNVVGEVYMVYLEPGQSLRQLAREHNMGYEEIVRANQHINPWKPKAWSKVLIPSSFILPNTRHEGIVINLPEMRLYYFPKDSDTMVTFPIGVGRQGWQTPTGMTKVLDKRKDPKWYVPESIKEHMAEKGVFLPDIVEAGPDNPLGAYALKLQLPGYLIHGTNKPFSVGKRSSSGCIRMYPEDIEQLFHMVSEGEKVRIINQPYKAGWYQEDLYIESHKPFWDQLPTNPKHDSLGIVVEYANKQRGVSVDWESAYTVHEKFTGYPQLITRGY